MRGAFRRTLQFPLDEIGKAHALPCGASFQRAVQVVRNISYLDHLRHVSSIQTCDAHVKWPLGSRASASRYNWNLENREIARIFWETADLMEIAGEDSFRIRSYRNGATAIEGYPERIADILRDPERKVTDIPGIGKGLAAVLQEIVDARLLRAPR